MSLKQKKEKTVLIQLIHALPFHLKDFVKAERARALVVLYGTKKWKTFYFGLLQKSNLILHFSWLGSKMKKQLFMQFSLTIHLQVVYK